MAVCPFAAWRPVVNKSRTMVHPVRGFIPHVQVGYGSLFDFFNTPARQASSHFWISRDGVLEQYVDTDVQAWAEAAGNPFFWSCEFEGMDTEPMTDAQLAKGAELIVWLRSIDAFPLQVNADPNGSGVTPHRAGGAAWGGHSCPGDIRLAQYPELVARATTPAGVPNLPSEEDVFIVQFNDWPGSLWLVEPHAQAGPFFGTRKHIPDPEMFKNMVDQGIRVVDHLVNGGTYYQEI